MATSATEDGWIPAATRWLRGLWKYYREYTGTAIHTAAAAALAIFGLLIFIDPLFAALAIASYVIPPLVLYSLDADLGREPGGSERIATDATPGNEASDAGWNTGDGDTDTDTGDGDTDTDTGDRATDTDADAWDTDTDIDDGDTDTDGDSDRDGEDTDSDGIDYDTDSDG